MDWPSRRPRALWSGSADQAARLSETTVAFARLCLCGVETAVAFAGAGRAVTETVIAFAGEKWAFLVQFLGAVVMSVSAFPCQVPGFMEACLGRFLSCCCVFVFCLLRCDSAQGEVRAACVVPVDPG